ncbi:MAG: FkbM family methyltransferase [Microthrixaceae bacterium]
MSLWGAVRPHVKGPAQAITSLPPVRSLLRTINASPLLAEASRHRFYVRVTRKAASDPRFVFSHDVPGGRTIRVHLDGTIRRLYWVGDYEREALPVFLAYAADARGVLDIGAAEGAYSLFSAAVNPDAHIVAFEPSSVARPRLLANVAANPWIGDRLRVSELALGDREGEATFFQTIGGTSSLNEHFRAATSSVSVQVAKGDRVVPELLGDVPVDLVKIDTESTEPDVLAGLEAIVTRDRPPILCEVLKGRCEPELQVIVGRLGYRTWRLDGDGPRRFDTVVGNADVEWQNWLLLPDDDEPRSPWGPGGRSR